MQLGGAAAPDQQPQVDILGARQTIDMLGVLADQDQGNRSEAESKLLDTALFELRHGLPGSDAGALAAGGQRGSRAQAMPPPPGGPSIVR